MLSPTQELALAELPSSPGLLPGTNVTVPVPVPVAPIPRMRAVELTNGKSYPNMVLADWRHLSGDQPKLFWGDGIHVRSEGARLYADLILQSLSSRHER